jgi:antitoxin component YwqK of YwqJK toxin-antitoxin module
VKLVRENNDKLNYTETEVDRQGLKHGFSRGHKHGILVTELTYIQDILNGYRIEWNSDGKQTRVESYVNGLLHGLSMSVYTDRSTGYQSFVNNETEGLYIEKYDDQWVTLLQYKDGNLHGKAYCWYLDGTLKHINCWVNGVKKGKQTYFHDNGIKRQEYTLINEFPCVYDGPIKEWNRAGIPIIPNI